MDGGATAGESFSESSTRYFTRRSSSIPSTSASGSTATDSRPTASNSAAGSQLRATCV